MELLDQKRWVLGPRSLARRIVLALPLMLLACPTRSPAPPPLAPLPASEEPAATNEHAAPHESDPTVAREREDDAGRKARLEQDARSMHPPDDPGAIPWDAQSTTSGIAYQVLMHGTGSAPGPQDTVKILVAAWTMDGAPVETFMKRETPTTIHMQRPPMPGLPEALALVKEGGTTRFWIPETLTGSTRGPMPKGPMPKGTLLFQISVIEVIAAPLTPVDVAAPPSDATVTRSGLATKILTPGTGDVHPDAHDRVTVHYSGWTTDGTLFDSSVTRGRPSTFPCNRVIEGWTEGLQRMVIGEKARFWIPEALAYKGQSGKPLGMLVFDIELLEIDEQPEPPPPPRTPKTVAKPPRRAKRTPSGLAYRVLAKGTGKEHPSATSMVNVHYSGWTTDGMLFDSSITRGKPTLFPLNRVIEGFSEAIQLMVVGEKTRFWIPEGLAYQGKPGKPAGMLVFDIELLAIED